MLQKLKKVVKKLLNNKKVPVVTLGIVALLILTAGLFTPMTQPTTASKKKLPIYCVDTQGKKQVSISFDAAWGAGKWGRCLLPYEITLLSNSSTRSLMSFFVLLPYEITLLSNSYFTILRKIRVLLPYEITLLSNLLTSSDLPCSVLLPYEITLLSNTQGFIYSNKQVLLPYEITLLSNHRKIFNFNIFVLLPYEITLLSNNKFV